MLGAIKPIAKRLFFAFAGSRPLLAAKLRSLASSDRLTILNFHRVGPPDGSAYPPLSPALFEEAVRFCSANFSVLTLAELAHHKRASKPPVVLSFDDGYRDFADYAAPIMKRYGVRCNHNVIPACIDSGLPPFNVHVQDFVGRAPAAALAQLDVPGFEISDTNDRLMLGNRLSAFIKNRPITEQKQLASCLMPQFERCAGFLPTPMMTLADIKGIAENHELGAHSFEHATLTFEDDDYVRSDAQACRAYFRDKLNVTTAIYAVPNGEIRPGILPILREHGFEQILLTGDDYSAVRNHEHPRFGMYGDSFPEVRFRASGFVRN